MTFEEVLEVLNIVFKPKEKQMKNGDEVQYDVENMKFKVLHWNRTNYHVIYWQDDVIPAPFTTKEIRGKFGVTKDFATNPVDETGTPLLYPEPKPVRYVPQRGDVVELYHGGNTKSYGTRYIVEGRDIHGRPELVAVSPSGAICHECDFKDVDYRKIGTMEDLCMYDEVDTFKD